MEKEKRKNCRPLAVERPTAAIFVFLVLPSEDSLHGAGIFLVLGSSISQLGGSYCWKDALARTKYNVLHVNWIQKTYGARMIRCLEHPPSM